MKLKPAIMLLPLVLLAMCTKQNFNENVKTASDESDLFGPGKNPLWEVFPGNNDTVRALPDWYSNYFAFSYDRTKKDSIENKYIGIRIKGQFGYARYMSFNFYDANEGKTYGSFTDTALKPDDGSANPYQANANYSASPRNYTLIVVPDLPDAKAVTAKNVFRYADSDINVLSVFIRYYAPESLTANVPLPDIEAFDVRTGDSIPIPKTFSLAKNGPPLIAYTLRMRKIWETAIDDTVRFFKVLGSGQFNNADNIYLISALKRTKDQVFVMRFRPPTFRHDKTTEGNTDVRYWSINEGKYNTTTPYGIKDSGFKVAKDGFVYIVLANEDDAMVSAKAQAGGYNFMKWALKDPMMVLLYRNLLSDHTYPGYLGNVGLLNLGDYKRDSINVRDSIIKMQNARNYIGDYAPQGLRMNRNDFLNNYGGWPFPGF